MLTYDEEGLQAARSFLERRRLDDDPKFHDLVEASLQAVPRVKVKGSFVRPEAAVLESLRATLFDDIEAPPDPDEQARDQLTFDV